MGALIIEGRRGRTSTDSRPGTNGTIVFGAVNSARPARHLMPLFWPIDRGSADCAIERNLGFRVPVSMSTVARVVHDGRRHINVSSLPPSPISQVYESPMAFSSYSKARLETSPSPAVIYHRKCVFQGFGLPKFNALSTAVLVPNRFPR